MLDNIWRDHCKAFQLIINLFLKLDRSSKSGGLWETGLEIFGRLVRVKRIEQNTVRYIVYSFTHFIIKVDGLLSMILRERNGDMVNRSLIKSLVSMLSSINMYTKFESELLSKSDEFFTRKSKVITVVYDYLPKLLSGKIKRTRYS